MVLVCIYKICVYNLEMVPKYLYCWNAVTDSVVMMVGARGVGLFQKSVKISLVFDRFNCKECIVTISIY